MSAQWSSIRVSLNNPKPYGNIDNVIVSQCHWLSSLVYPLFLQRYELNLRISFAIIHESIFDYWNMNAMDCV